MKEKTKKENPIVFSISIPAKEVKKAYDQLLVKLIAKTKVKGFREGKASAKLVEEKLGKNAIYSQVIEVVLPPAYQSQVEKRGLQPMIQPRVKAISLKEKEAWEFEITVVEKPPVDLGNWEEAIKKALAPLKIVKPGEEKENQTARDNKNLQVAFDALLEASKVDLPKILIEEEVNLRLTKLLDQVQSLGMTIDGYLKAKNLTHQKIREEYEQSVRKMLTLNLALEEIASLKKMSGKNRIPEVIKYLTNL